MLDQYKVLGKYTSYLMLEEVSMLKVAISFPIN